MRTLFRFIGVVIFIAFYTLAVLMVLLPLLVKIIEDFVINLFNGKKVNDKGEGDDVEEPSPEGAD